MGWVMGREPARQENLCYPMGIVGHSLQKSNVRPIALVIPVGWRAISSTHPKPGALKSRLRWLRAPATKKARWIRCLSGRRAFFKRPVPEPPADGRRHGFDRVARWGDRNFTDAFGDCVQPGT